VGCEEVWGGREHKYISTGSLQWEELPSGPRRRFRGPSHLEGGGPDGCADWGGVALAVILGHQINSKVGFYIHLKKINRPAVLYVTISLLRIFAVCEVHTVPLRRGTTGWLLSLAFLVRFTPKQPITGKKGKKPSGEQQRRIPLQDGQVQ